MEKGVLLWIGTLVLALCSGLSSCSSDDDLNYSLDKVNILNVAKADKSSSYEVSDPVCFTDGLTSNYKAPTFFCRLDESSGFASLYIGYAYNYKTENVNNFYLEDINVGDILGFDDFQVLLTIPNHGWSIERHDWVATSGTIKVIDKKGSGDNLTFTLMLNNVEFTTSRVNYARRHTRQDDSVYCTINGVIRFEYTNRYNN